MAKYPITRMRYKLIIVLVVSFSLLIAYTDAGYGSIGGPPLYVPGEVLVKFKPDVFPYEMDRIRQELRLIPLYQFKNINVEQFKIGSGLTVSEVINLLNGSGLVEYAEPNYYRYKNVIPDDPSVGNLWGLHNTGQTGGTPDADIDAPEAWDITTGSNTVVVAVIDSGMDLSHPDLAGNIWSNPGEIPGNGLDDDNNGYVDDVNGWDFARKNNDPSDSEGICRGHGTHVSGTIGASGNNGIGVTGVNWDVSIMPLKVFKKVTSFFTSYCAASDSDIIRAVEYASKFGVKVSNNSYGGGPFGRSLFNAIRASRNIFVAAAGNGGSDGIGDNNDKQPYYPASYDLPNIVSVSATDHNYQLAPFSNYGLKSVDLAAPGVNILSTTPNNGYKYYSGTSMATPHVASTFALLFSSDPTLTINEGKWRILKGVDPKGLPVLSGGRLNILNSLTLPPPMVTTDVEMVDGITTLYRGGYGHYSMLLTNQTLIQQQVKVLILAQLPDGQEVILKGPTMYTLIPGEVRYEFYSDQVPLTAPLGDYLLIGRAEVETGSFDEDTASFSIVP